MSLDFKHVAEIQRPPDEVFAYIADFENNPTWQGGMVSCEWTSAEKMQVGSTYKQQARFFGRPIITQFRVTAVQPGESISIESTVSTFPIQVTRSVQAIEGGCRVTAHIRGQPTGLMKLFSGMVQKTVAKDYAALKKQLEG